MNGAFIEARLRRFLLIMVEFLCIGTVIELWLSKHTKETQQFIPFVLCASAFLSVLAVLVRPQRSTILILRVIMVALVLGSLLGVYYHLSSKFAFEAEMRPGTATFDTLLIALMGAAPLLAPGILALAGTLALVATYYHPALGKRSED